MIALKCIFKLWIKMHFQPKFSVFQHLRLQIETLNELWSRYLVFNYVFKTWCTRKEKEYSPLVLNWTWLSPFEYLSLSNWCSCCVYIGKRLQQWFGRQIDRCTRQSRIRNQCYMLYVFNDRTKRFTPCILFYVYIVVV